MQSPTPYGIREEVRKLVMATVNAMRTAGWIINRIHWDSEIKRTVRFVAKSPSGKTVFVVCGGAELVGRLQEILDGK